MPSTAQTVPIALKPKVAVLVWRVLFCLVAILSLHRVAALADESVLLNGRTVKPSSATTQAFLGALKENVASRTMHGLASFNRLVTNDDKKILAELGLHLLEPFEGYVYWVTVDKRLKLQGLKARNLTVHLVRLQPQDRVSPPIWAANYDSFIARMTEDKPMNYVLNEDATLNLTVQIHRDVNKRIAESVLRKYAKKIEKKDGITWVIVVPPSAVQKLAAEDIVQWVGAGPLPPRSENDVARNRVHVDPVQNFDVTAGQVRGAGGVGVKVGIFDGGIEGKHHDFGGRVEDHRGGAIKDDILHGTGVASTIGGSGKMSDQPDSKAPGVKGERYQWRGMAPEATLFDVSNNTGDDKATHIDLITAEGMDISNHSYWVSLDGVYELTDRKRDQIIRGNASVPPRLHVYSAGNGGEACSSPGGLCSSQPYQTGYFSLTKQLKNGLVVGNWNANGLVASERDQIYKESSLGPAYDGRIKPDVVAPGTNQWTAVYYPGPPYYGGGSGTSFSTPVVTGSLTLVLQQYAVSNVNLNGTPPLPSTLRALMIHTAEDKEIPDGDPRVFQNADGPVQPKRGPDFVTGWGLINAEKAVGAVREHRVIESYLKQACEEWMYAFTAGAADPVRVTLAWDDLPSAAQNAASTNRQLRNDLDLILVDPNGVSHYPWKLDQKIVDSSGTEISDSDQRCGTPVLVERQFKPTLNPQGGNDVIPAGGIPTATRGRDHLNNVEVADIEAPIAAGTWQARIVGFNIYETEGPQQFSLVGYPFREVSVPLILKCKIHELGCLGQHPLQVCQLNPWVCSTKVVLPTKGLVRFTLGSPRDKAILPLSELCRTHGQCQFPAKLSLEVRANKLLEVKLYEANGKVIQAGDPNQLKQQFSFLRNKEIKDHFLVFSERKGTAYPTGRSDVAVFLR